MHRNNDNRSLEKIDVNISMINICFVFNREDEINFISPIQKLTKEELREELKVFHHSSQSALLDNTNNNDDDDDTGDIQFRIQQPIKRSICCSQYSFSFKETSCIIS